MGKMNSGRGIAATPANSDRSPATSKWNRLDLVLGPEQDLHLLCPDQIPFIVRVGLKERQSLDAPFRVDLQFRAYRGATGLFDPCAAPGMDIDFATLVEDTNQIRPCRVSEPVLIEINLQALPKSFLSEYELELTHHDGSFLIDDCAVQAARFVQVCQFLADGMRAGGPVYGIRRRVVRHEKAEVMIDLGEGGVHDLRRHEVGEHFLHPHVVEPPHRDQVTEPHVRCFVGDHTCPSQHLGSGWPIRRAASGSTRKKMAPGCSMPPNWKDGIRTKSNLSKG